VIVEKEASESMEVLDLDILNRFYDEVCDNELEILVDIASDCVTETEALAADISNSFATKDWEVFNRSAHSMKSTAKSLGGDQLSEHAKDLEYNSCYKDDDFNPSVLIEPVAELNGHVTAFVSALRNEVAKLGGSI